MSGLIDAIFGGGDTVDYTPVANASKEAAELSTQLGREQLAEAQRQYNQNMKVATPVVNAQLDVMRQGIQQGNDYYDYMKSFRPLEQQMLGEAGAGTGDANRAAIEQFEQGANADIALYTGGNKGIYDKYRSDIDADVGTAVADARTGQTQAMNSAMRQAMRYGLSVPTNAQALTNQNAAQLAAAANNTRGNAIDNYRGLVGQGIGLKKDAFTTGRNMRIQDESLDWARKLDVTGMARGLPGASQGAYGVAVGAGNSATQNQMAPGQALVGTMGQSAGTQLQGRNIAMNGLTSILGSQTSASNASNNMMGEIVGAGIGAFAASDRRLKERIVLVGRDEATGLNLYEFSYMDDARRYVGVMADEVEPLFPRAVEYDDLGFASVNYQMLGIEFKEVA